MNKDDPISTGKALVAKKLSQVAEKTPEGQLGLAVIKRAVRDINTKHEDPDCWFDGSLDDFTGPSGINPDYIVRKLREYNLIPQTRVLAS